MVIKNIGIPKSFPIGKGTVVQIPTGESSDHPNLDGLIRFVNAHPDLSFVEVDAEKPAAPEPAPTEPKKKLKKLKSKEKVEESEPEKVEEDQPTEEPESTEG